MSEENKGVNEVNEVDESVDQPESPTGEQAESNEEYEARIAKLEESNKTLIKQLRNKETKALTVEEPEDNTEDDSEEEDPRYSELKAEVEALKKKDLEKKAKAEKSALQQFFATETGKNYQNDGTEEQDAKFNKLSDTYKFLTERDGEPETEEQRMRMLKEADVILRKEYASDVKKELITDTAMKMAAGVGGGSTSRGEEGSKQLTPEQIELAKKCGNDPKDVY